VSKFVLFDAEKGKIVVSLDQGPVGAASTAPELAELLKSLALDLRQDRMYCSSSIDWASEYGFGSDGAAEAIINAALDQYSEAVV